MADCRVDVSIQFDSKLVPALTLHISDTENHLSEARAEETGLICPVITSIDLNEDSLVDMSQRETLLMAVHLLSAEALRICRQKQLNLAAAESCTGGGISAALTSHAGSSDVFLGGVVSYSNQLKQDLLNVPPALLDRYGAVSEQTASAMAEGCMAASRSGAALSVTGIAGPGGGSAEKPVGLVFTAVSRKLSSGDRETSVYRWLFPGDREVNRLLSQAAALAHVCKCVTDS